MKYSQFNERAYARSASPDGPVPVEAMGRIYPDFGHRFRQQNKPAAGTPRVAPLDLGIGTYFTCAEEIVEAGVAALRQGHTRYETVDRLKDAICAKFLDEQNIALTNENVLLLGAARPGMALTLLAGIDPGDTIVIPDPDYIGLTHMACAVGANVVRAPMTRADDGRLSLDLSALDRLADSGFSALILTNPGNPTGNVLSREDLRAISGIADKAGAFVMVNEIYDKLMHGGQFTSYAAVGDLDTSIVVGGTSKSYEMTGFGIGWLISSPANVARMEDLAFLTHQSKPDAVSQYAALAALSAPVRNASPARSVEVLKANARRTAEALDGYEGCRCPLPIAGQFAFPYVGGDDLELARFLLDEVALQVVPGSVWGSQGAGHLRLALANSPDHQAEGLSRLREGIARFRRRQP